MISGYRISTTNKVYRERRYIDPCLSRWLFLPKHDELDSDSPHSLNTELQLIALCQLLLCHPSKITHHFKKFLADQQANLQPERGSQEGWLDKKCSPHFSCSLASLKWNFLILGRIFLVLSREMTRNVEVTSLQVLMRFRNNFVEEFDDGGSLRADCECTIEFQVEWAWRRRGLGWLKQRLRNII